MKRSLIIIILISISGSILYAIPPSKKIRFKVKSVSYQGNKKYSASQLNKVILSRPSSIINPVYYIDDIFQDDLRGLPLFYQQNGYLEAKVTNYNVSLDSVKRAARISFTIEEGKLTRIEGISILGNSIITDQDIQVAIPIKEGKALKSKEIENSTLIILRKYAEIGYLDADIKPDVRINSEAHTALIDFIIEEKGQYKISKISISGLEKSKSFILTRELNFKAGEIVNYSKLLQSQRQLYLTGLFESVFIRPIPPKNDMPNTKDILIETKEKTFGEFNVSVGYGTIEKIRGKTEISYNNLRGSAQKLGLIFKLSFINRGIELSFTEPWTFHTRWRTDLATTYEYLKEPGYDLTRLGARIAIGRKFREHSNSTITYRYENDKLSQIKVPNIPAEMKSNIRALKLSLIFDNRDNLFNTTKGTYIEFSNELAGSFLYGTNSFFRSNLLMKKFLSAGINTFIGTHLDLAWIDAAGGLSSIPLYERLYAGGPNALRAFDYQTVGPVEVDDEGNFIPSGGRYSLVWNVIEIRQSVYKSFGLEGFVDLGNVWKSPKDVALSDIRHSLGIGVRYNSLIGLARMDYAVNLSPHSGEDKGKIYFSMGQAF